MKCNFSLKKRNIKITNFRNSPLLKGEGLGERFHYFIKKIPWLKEKY
jgi:hypothetical protein